MEFFANENFPYPSVTRLRRAGLTVLTVSEECPGATDAEVLSRAAAGRLIVLTFDRDYGELIFRARKPVPAGIVYLRFRPSDPDEPAKHLLKLLDNEEFSFEGKFTVLDRRQARQRPLP